MGAQVRALLQRESQEVDPLLNMANACEHDQRVPALHTMDVAVETVARFRAGSAADGASAFDSRAEGSASPSTNATGPGSASRLCSALSLPFQLLTMGTRVSSAPSAAGLLSLGGTGRAVSSFGTDAQTPSALARDSMCPLAAP